AQCVDRSRAGRIRLRVRLVSPPIEHVVGRDVYETFAAQRQFPHRLDIHLPRSLAFALADVHVVEGRAVEHYVRLYPLEGFIQSTRICDIELCRGERLRARAEQDGQVRRELPATAG